MRFVGAAIGIGVLAVAGALVFADAGAGEAVPLACAAGALLVAAALARRHAAVHPALLVTLIALGFVRWPYPIWPLYFAGPLAVYGALVAVTPPWRRAAAGWFRAGRLDRAALAWVAVVSAVAAAALFVYTKVQAAELAGLRWQVPQWRGALFVLGGAGFAIVNAVMEELVFRGVFQAALEDALGAAPAVVLQAVSFGLIHVAAFPRGAVGVAMAATYGLALGLMKRRTGGLLAPILSHALVDGAIFVLLTGLSR